MIRHLKLKNKRLAQNLMLKLKKIQAHHEKNMKYDTNS